MFKSICISVGISIALAVGSAEQLSPKTPEEFLFGEKLSLSDGVISVRQPSVFYSLKRMTIDPAKQYRLSGEFRTVPGNKDGSIVRFGVVPFTSQRQIVPKNINVVAGTETELAADCQAADLVVKVKDASKWTDSPLGRIAFDIDPEGKMRDLPNFNIAEPVIKRITFKDGIYEVELSAQCGVNYAEGTQIRLHNDGWILIFAGGSDNKLTNQWQVFSHTFAPGTVAAADNLRWWKGTELAAIYIDCLTSPAGNTTEFKNIILEELPEKQ